MDHLSVMTAKKENKKAIHLLIALFAPIYVLSYLYTYAVFIRRYCPELPKVLMDIFGGRYSFVAAPYMHLSVIFPVMLVICIICTLGSNSSSKK